MTTGQRFEHVVAIMHRLRAPGGCPWDREQTFDSIKKHTVEETYEVLEAIENRDWEELPGELGDLLLQVLFYAEMAGEEGHFSIDNVLQTLSDKLVRRHPHVFGDVEAATSKEVLKNWEAIKTLEKAQKAPADNPETTAKPLLASVSSAMPALLEGTKLSNKAAHVGFDWPSIDGLFDKLQEEAAELRREVDRIPAPGPQPLLRSSRGVAGANAGSVSAELQARLQDEVGDLLFTVVNMARYLDVDPESALRQTNRKFRHRFGYMESRLREAGTELADASLDQMESHWQQSKAVDPK